MRERRAREGYGQRSHEALCGAARPRRRALDAAQDLDRVLVEGLAARRQLDAARKAPEERESELLLEVLDLLAQRRLLQAEAFGGARHALGFGDGDEVAQVAQFHEASSMYSQIVSITYEVDILQVGSRLLSCLVPHQPPRRTN